MSAQRDRCRSCGVEIVWLAHERTKKPAPIEVEPRVDGNVYLVAWDDALETFVPTGIGRATHYHVMTKAEKEDVDAGRFPGLRRRVSHFVGCKDAPHWSERSREKSAGR